MSLAQQLEQQLQDLSGVSPPDVQTVAVTGNNRIELAVDVTAVDSMSCSIREIRLSVPSLANTGTDILRQWADEVCRRVNYLLENIGPLEVDEHARQVLIRSTPPDRRPEETVFYEIVLKSHSSGRFSLSRFRTQRDHSAREQVDMQTTREVLTKLVDDLEQSIPELA